MVSHPQSHPGSFHSIEAGMQPPQLKINCFLYFPLLGSQPTLAHFAQLGKVHWLGRLCKSLQFSSCWVLQTMRYRYSEWG